MHFSLLIAVKKTAFRFFSGDAARLIFTGDWNINSPHSFQRTGVVLPWVRANT